VFSVFPFDLPFSTILLFCFSSFSFLLCSSIRLYHLQQGCILSDVYLFSNNGNTTFLTTGFHLLWISFCRGCTFISLISLDIRFHNTSPRESFVANTIFFSHFTLKRQFLLFSINADIIITRLRFSASSCHRQGDWVFSS